MRLSTVRVSELTSLVAGVHRTHGVIDPGRIYSTKDTHDVHIHKGIQVYIGYRHPMESVDKKAQNRKMLHSNISIVSVETPKHLYSNISTPSTISTHPASIEVGELALAAHGACFVASVASWPRPPSHRSCLQSPGLSTGWIASRGSGSARNSMQIDEHKQLKNGNAEPYAR